VKKEIKIPVCGTAHSCKKQLYVYINTKW
jgi:hypothetical protein